MLVPNEYDHIDSVCAFNTGCTCTCILGSLCGMNLKPKGPTTKVHVASVSICVGGVIRACVCTCAMCIVHLLYVHVCMYMYMYVCMYVHV